MTRLIDNLEKRNLVKRLSDNEDRRINNIYLTEEGNNLQNKATEIVNLIAERTLKGITEQELNTSRVVLKKIMANLEQ